MQIPSWTPLWSKLVDSSIWDESDLVCKVFMTMLALKDAEHVVRCNAYELGRKSRKTELEVLEALKVLASPDTRRVEPQPFDGRRIKAVEGGWLVLNGQHYKEMMQQERVRAKNARAARKYREKQKMEKDNPVRSLPLPGEQENVRRWADGEQADTHP